MYLARDVIRRAISMADACQTAAHDDRLIDNPDRADKADANAAQMMDLAAHVGRSLAIRDYVETRPQRCWDREKQVRDIMAAHPNKWTYGRFKGKPIWDNDLIAKINVLEK